jgi:anti-anti-sigma regulatory factor
MGQAEPSDRPVLLPADCTIGAIRQVYELVRDAFIGRQGKLEIDCSSVDRADVTSVQLLVSASKTASQAGRAIGWSDPSQVLRQTLERAGVSGEPVDPLTHQSKAAHGDNPDRR